MRGGGVRSHLSQKSHVSCQLGHEARVIAPGPRDGPGRAGDAVDFVRGPPLPYDPTYHLLWRLDKVRERVTRERPDVLEIHSPYLAAVSALSIPRSAFGVRTFVWHADFIDTYLRDGLERRFGGPRVVDAVVEPLWAWVRTIARASDATFVASRWQLGKLEAHGVPRLVHLPFGVEKATFRPEARDPALRAEILGGRRGPLVVAIGRFAVEKRWDVVFDAFARWREPEAVLAVFGDGPERAALEARSRGEDVRFFGFERDRDRLARALASSDVLLHGCPHETFGLGVAEAIATGLPAVLPDKGGAAEQADPASTELYASGDAAACAAALKRITRRDPAGLRAAALAAAARVGSVEDHFRALYGVYRDLLARRGARG